MSSRAKPTNETTNSVVYSCAFGALFGIVLSIAACLVASIIINNTDISGGVIKIIGFSCAALGALIGGFIAARKSSARGILCGLISGICMAFILYLCGWVIGGAPSPLGSSVISIIIPIAAATIGGVIGANTKK